MSVDIQPLPSSDAPEAARTLARAFVTNPLNQAAFGRDALARNEAFFRLGLSVMRGENFAAMEGSRILGVVHWVEAPACVFSPGQKLGMLPAMIRSLGLDASKVNPMGGAIALGHALGATGAIRAATVVHALRRQKLRYGMVTMCVGMGQCAAGRCERV